MDKKNAGHDAGKLDYSINPSTGLPWTFKYQRIVYAHLDRTWNTFEAMPELFSSCLHSDIAELERKGITFDHLRETHIGFGGARVPCVRYRIKPESVPNAKHLLGLPS